MQTSYGAWAFTKSKSRVFFLWMHHPAASPTLQGFLGFPQARTWARKAKIYYLLNMPWLPAPGSVLQASWPHFLGAHIPCLVPARPPPRSQVLAPLTLPCWQTTLQALPLHRLSWNHWGCLRPPAFYLAPEAEPSGSLIVQVALFWTHSNWAP